MILPIIRIFTEINALLHDETEVIVHFCIAAVSAKPVACTGGCGVPCEELVIYENMLEAECEFADRLYSEVKHPYTYVTFTSASCVEGFVKSVGAERDYSAVKAICIGDKTAQKASDYGMRFWVAEEPSLNRMIKCLESIT